MYPFCMDSTYVASTHPVLKHWPHSIADTGINLLFSWWAGLPTILFRILLILTETVGYFAEDCLRYLMSPFIWWAFSGENVHETLNL